MPRPGGGGLQHVSSKYAWGTINLLTNLTDQGCTSVVEPCTSFQRQLSWSLCLRLPESVPGEWRDMSKACSKVGLPDAPLASCCHLEGEAGSDEAVKKARINVRCSPCFHLLHPLLRLDPTAAAAPQKKVAMTKVQSESQRAVAILQQQKTLRQETTWQETTVKRLN